MCDCVGNYDYYKHMRKADNQSRGNSGIAGKSPFTDQMHAAWARYEQARNECDNPGQHPHRQK